MQLIVISLVGLVLLYSLSLYCGYVLHIAKDGFYAPFHFLGGALTGLFFYSLSHNGLLTLVFTLIVGVLWEIHEQIVWKLLIKKKKLRPGLQDTVNDLILDLLGSLVIVLFIQ